MKKNSSVSMLSAERHRLLIEFINIRQNVSIADVCEYFSISEATARRDLDLLAERGLIERVHGGAVSKETRQGEPPVLLREKEQYQEKKRIAMAASNLIQDGETVFLGSGTTVVEVAKNLVSRKNFTVITNSLLVANILADQNDITVVMIGGILRHSEFSLIGHLANEALLGLRVDKVIIGIHSIDSQYGLTNEYMPEIETDRAILGIGKQIIVLADHTKCGHVSVAFLAPVNSMDILITDQAVSDKFESEMISMGVKVIKA